MLVMSTGPQTLQKAEGERLILGCRYTPSPSDTGELDIEWSVVSPDTTQKDHMLLSFTSGTTYIHGDSALGKGFRFAAPDPSMGDASMSISPLSPAHSATYQCKVKKSPGVDATKVSLVVMAKPSVPQCWVEGGELIGGAVSLHCQSAGGSTPLLYSWRRESTGPLPAAATQDVVSGELRIRNHSQSSAGFYLCEVNNAVGAAHCRINLKANKPPNRAAVIVGSIVGSLLLIFILLVFIGLILWKLSSRRGFEKEFSNDIRKPHIVQNQVSEFSSVKTFDSRPLFRSDVREDAPPPESRPVSRRTNRSSSQPTPAYRQVGSPNDGHTHSPSSQGHTPDEHTPECDSMD
ncbi:hypothetical protein KUCAC02_008698 [Chaenocephalus aceratus]|uniref:Uncharacterized protein n=1 Tax=Chaenocephalus aceratus TaxID=36190 RepID=A0ACB9WT23_CHAAC|nr:hypothetical protein KUCAC02_008698 [Chaenocephalus aceratus]